MKKYLNIVERYCIQQSRSNNTADSQDPYFMLVSNDNLLGHERKLILNINKTKEVISISILTLHMIEKT
jgi:hypothetical protein